VTGVWRDTEDAGNGDSQSCPSIGDKAGNGSSWRAALDTHAVMEMDEKEELERRRRWLVGMEWAAGALR
jgi:hypothetical protein